LGAEETKKQSNIVAVLMGLVLFSMTLFFNKKAAIRLDETRVGELCRGWAISSKFTQNKTGPPDTEIASRRFNNLFMAKTFILSVCSIFSLISFKRTLLQLGPGVGQYIQKQENGDLIETSIDNISVIPRHATPKVLFNF
jgi:hypothetical protein